MVNKTNKKLQYKQVDRHKTVLNTRTKVDVKSTLN